MTAHPSHYLLAHPERRACPSEVLRVIPSLVLCERDAMRKTLNEAEQRAMRRVYTGAPLTGFGEWK